MRLLGNEQGEIDRCGTDERRHRFGKRNQRNGWNRWCRAHLTGSAIVAAKVVLRLSMLMRGGTIVGSRGVMLGWLMLAKRHGDRGKALQAQSQNDESEYKLPDHLRDYERIPRSSGSQPVKFTSDKKKIPLFFE